MFKYVVLAALFLLNSCLSPDEINVTADPDAVELDHFLRQALQLSENQELVKSVQLDQSTESKKIPVDSTTLKKDLKGLLDYSFKRLIRSSNYNKTQKDHKVIFERKPTEKNGPLTLIISKNESGLIDGLEAEFKNENYLYKSSQWISLRFETGNLVHYKVEGVRKLIGLEQSNFLIEASIE